MDNTDDIVVGPVDESGLAPGGNGGDYGAGDDSGVMQDLREMPVGTNDPNIVGNVGPTDVPPGTDPRGEDELVLADDDRPVESDDPGGTDDVGGTPV